MTLPMEETIRFAIEEALEKFGQYNTPDLFNRVFDVVERNPGLPIDVVVDEVALCLIINDDIYAAQRTHGFLHLLDISRQVFDESLELGERLGEANSILWTRNHQITRDRIGIWKKTAEHFVEWMREKNTWVEEYFGADAIKHLHPYVQVRMLDNATMSAAQNAVEVSGMKWSATVESKDGVITITPVEPGVTTAPAVLKEALELYISKEFLPDELSEDDTDAIKQAVLDYFTKKQPE